MMMLIKSINGGNGRSDLPRLGYVLLILSLAFAFVQGVDIYVATTGNDGDSGTVGAPLASLTEAIGRANPGDVIWLRGGDYHPGATTRFNKIGTRMNPFTVRPYTGEQVTIDGQDTDGTWVFKEAEYWNIYGPLTLTMGDHAGIYIDRDTSNIHLEQITSSYNGWKADRGAHGFFIWGSNIANITYLNCDAHHNANHQTKPGEDVGVNLYQHGDGWRIFHGVNVRLIGCRAWNNLDDAYDFTQATDPIEMIECWAAYSGYDDAMGSLTGEPNRAMSRWEGDGIKLGYPGHTGQHRAIRCLSWENHCHGWNVQGGPYEIWNSASYQNLEVEYYIGSTGMVHDQVNSYSLHSSDQTGISDRPVTITSADFVSLDSTGMLGPRQADGSLPEIPFLNLKADSDMIDAGVGIGGISYIGSAPDVGFWEASYSSGSPISYIQSITTDQDTSVAITLTGYDPQEDPLSYIIVSGPSNGSLSNTPPNVTYTPNKGFLGSDSFTFKVNDGLTDSNTATVSITVIASKQSEEGMSSVSHLETILSAYISAALFL